MAALVGSAAVVHATMPALAVATEGVPITATDFAFEPTVIRTEPRDRMEVVLHNTGKHPHNIAFYVEEGGAPLNDGSVGPITDPGATTSMGFDLPGEGRYFFTCDVHPIAMQGVLLVGDEGTARVDEPRRPPVLPLGPDPRLDPSAFRVTTFASGLPYAMGMQALRDGSLLVGVNAPGTQGFHRSNGKLLRLADPDGDGVAEDVTPIGILVPTDGDGPPVYEDLQGAIVQMRLVGDLLVMTTRQRAISRIVVLRSGESVTAPWTRVGTLTISYPDDQQHQTYGLAVREAGPDGTIEVFFNVGSRFNARNDVTRIPIDGLAEGSLIPESVYRLTLRDDGTAVTVTDLRPIAAGLRNAAGLAFHPATGDLYLQDNGIDREDDPEDQLSPDELNVIHADDVGRILVDFGFARDHIGYRTGERVGTGGQPPLVAFQPMAGSEAEGAAEIAFAPPGFPPPFDDGIFVGFHGRHTAAGLANEENPLLYVDLDEGSVLEFVPNDAPDVGHLDSILATADSLFIGDLNRGGQLSTSDPDGVIYQVKRSERG